MARRLLYTTPRRRRKVTKKKEPVKEKKLTEAKEIQGHTMTIGGITLETDSGKISHIMPVVQYTGLRDDQTQAIWHHLQECEELVELQKKMSECVLKHMTEFGDSKIRTLSPEAAE